jgi:hypothetical protein
LTRHHLKHVEEAESLKIVAFNPWWYPNEDAATRAFFQSLYVVLGKRLTEQGRKVFLSLGKKLLSSGTLISTAVNFFTFGLGGKMAETAASAAAEIIKTDRTAEEDYRLLADELRKQQTKFLVIIDDIDRLTPEQALVIFRLVKSVGRLPNVIYLLASEVPIVMDDLMGSCESILLEKVPAFMSSMFEIMDELDLERDDEGGFTNHGTNQLRMHWLINELVRDRFEQAERSRLLRNALQGAGLGWMIEFTRRTYDEYQPRNERQILPPQRLVDATTAAEFTAATLQKIRHAAETASC